MALAYGVYTGTLGRMTIDKQFHGDLEAINKGQMFTAVTGANTSARYLAVERINGRLRGHSSTASNPGTVTP